jgi:hypothetical protein
MKSTFEQFFYSRNKRYHRTVISLRSQYPTLVASVELRWLVEALILLESWRLGTPYNTKQLTQRHGLGLLFNSFFASLTCKLHLSPLLIILT